jgi:hypothetical protein
MANDRRFVREAAEFFDELMAARERRLAESVERGGGGFRQFVLDHGFEIRPDGSVVPPR